MAVELFIAEASLIIRYFNCLTQGLTKTILKWVDSQTMRNKSRIRYDESVFFILTISESELVLPPTINKHQNE